MIFKSFALLESASKVLTYCKRHNTVLFRQAAEKVTAQLKKIKKMPLKLYNGIYCISQLTSFLIN